MGKKGHGGHHGGAWKVAYADFVTAMMAFFMVLWLLNTSDATRVAVATYFRHPGVFKSGGTGFLDREGMIELRDRLQQVERAAQGQPATSLPSDSTSAPEQRAIERSMLTESARQLQEMIEGSPELKDFQGQLNISFTEEGLRIQIEDSGMQSLFELGSTEPKEHSKQLLSAIARVLNGLPNPIVVEGHTDSRPFQGRDHYSNWELSGERANAARRILEDSGIDPTRIVRVVGFGDRKLLDPERPLSERNRRISIIVRYQDAPID